MRGSETVLIADDHESIPEMARHTLVSLGYRVLCAADGEEGLWLCEQNTPQIAVLAVVMAKLGGTATADKLLERSPGLRVIFSSGYSRHRDERTANLSLASYLQKPYSPRNWEDWCAIFWTARKNGPFHKLARATERFRG